jgi:hypothetical protein
VTRLLELTERYNNKRLAERIEKPRITDAALEIGELVFPDHTGVAVHLALDLVLGKSTGL